MTGRWTGRTGRWAGQAPGAAPRQLTLDLADRPALGRGAFHVTPANATALARVEDDDRWPHGRLALVGPAAAGKTHLAQVWAAATGAVVVDAAALPHLDLPALAAAGRVVVEDVPVAAGHPGAEAALFHLHNLIDAGGGRLLVTGRATPARWPLRLPDLASRMQAIAPVAIAEPDDALLAALLAKGLADRRLKADPAVIAYLVARMTRTAAAAMALADALDRLSLAEHRAVSRPLAARALAMADPMDVPSTDAGGDRSRRSAPSRDGRTTCP